MGYSHVGSLDPEHFPEAQGDGGGGYFLPQPANSQLLDQNMLEIRSFCPGLLFLRKWFKKKEKNS